MSSISTHILDLSKGLPAAQVPVKLERQDGTSWKELNAAKTDADGRVKSLLPAGQALQAGVYRLRFETGSYFQGAGFYPYVEIVFEIREASRHHHVPLLLSPFGYSTYRGS